MNNYCVSYPRKNVWIVKDIQGKFLGEVGAMSKDEARVKAAQNVTIPFTLKKSKE